MYNPTRIQSMTDKELERIINILDPLTSKDTSDGSIIHQIFIELIKRNRNKKLKIILK